MNVTFIVGCSRSGTTSLTRTLELSHETRCLSEPAPHLNLESREMFEGRLADPDGVLRRDLGPRVEAGLAERPHYIEKQVSLVPFLKRLVRLFDCRLVIPVRDGRDVVASLINWHNQMFPIIYQECREPAELGVHARQVRERQQGIDPFDYSLPRPPLHDPWREEWAGLSRIEMVTWYWQYLNLHILRQLEEEIPPERYLLVDYTRPTPETIQRVYDFLGLSGFDEAAVAAILDRRVNSLEDRIGERSRFPEWTDWPAERLQRFYDIAFGAMHRLGYAESPTRPQPPGFGEYWRDEEQDTAWYEKIYQYREPSHRGFQRWFSQVQEDVGPLESVIEHGCGRGVGYADFFADRTYIGVDMVPASIDYCRRHRRSPHHDFLCCDPIAVPPAIRADLVVSHASIDNVYDIDAWLRAMAKMTDKLLYVSNYRGYFGALNDHRYRWDPGMRVFFNDVSAGRAERVLRDEGFASVVVFPSASGRDDIARETVIIASREPVDRAVLMTGHRLCLEFEPYRASPSTTTRQEIVDAVNSGCAAFSANGLDLANPLSLLYRVLGDLRGMEHRCTGTMGELARTESGINTAIRVDVDMDLVAAVEMAATARRYSVPLSFFLLHTAPYYGVLVDGELQRNEAAADLYRQLEDGGNEVGLHVDALRLYLDHGIDGAAAVVAEIEWLRAQGLTIHGTAAHNAAPVYGAENFEIFAERNIHRREYYVRDHVYVPLGTLEESALGLTYEAGSVRPPDALDGVDEYLAGLPEGDFLRDPAWLRTYLLDSPYCSWGYDYRIWLLGRDLWTLAGRNAGHEPVFEHGIAWEDVAARLDALDSTATACVVLHPIYLGRRRAAGQPPEGASVLAQSSEP